MKGLTWGTQQGESVTAVVKPWQRSTAKDPTNVAAFPLVPHKVATISTWFDCDLQVFTFNSVKQISCDSGHICAGRSNLEEEGGKKNWSFSW